MLLVKMEYLMKLRRLKLYKIGLFLNVLKMLEVFLVLFFIIGGLY